MVVVVLVLVLLPICAATAVNETYRQLPSLYPTWPQPLLLLLVSLPPPR